MVVRYHNMDIIKGSLDGISRPASSELTGSRVSSVSLPNSERYYPTTPFTLEVLTKDALDFQFPNTVEETGIRSSAGDCYQSEIDPQLQTALEEMRRLDEMLTAVITREKQAKAQLKRLKAKLWQELMDSIPVGHAECAQEAKNTRMFLALEAPLDLDEDEDFVPVFTTQLCEKQPHNPSESFEEGLEETDEEQFDGRHRGASKDREKQKDFVKRNIELARGDQGQMLFTKAEEARLAELLRDTDEEDTDTARGAVSEEDAWAVSVLSGQGYTPQPSDLQQLSDIDSKLQLLLPRDEFLSVQSSFSNLRAPPILGPGVDRRCDDQQPGEKVLQDIKERREEERRLQEINSQLKLLDQDRGMDGLLDLI
ncbi:fibrous sheath-interacting protein 1 isoform 1-T3 [Synchiropus picturatus]